MGTSEKQAKRQGLACAAEFRENRHLGPDVAQSPRLRAVVTAVALVVEREARKRAPVDTGRLRASITHRVTPGRYGPVAEVGTNVDYAAAQEFGGGTMPGKRYMGGALRAAATLLRRRS